MTENISKYFDIFFILRAKIDGRQSKTTWRGDFFFISRQLSFWMHYILLDLKKFYLKRKN